MRKSIATQLKTIREALVKRIAQTGDPATTETYLHVVAYEGKLRGSPEASTLEVRLKRLEDKEDRHARADSMRTVGIGHRLA